MKQYTYNIKSAYELRACLFNERPLKRSESSASVLVSVRLYKDDQNDYNSIYKVVKEYLPVAIVIGQTTYGGIAEGLIEDESYTVSILMFDSTQVMSSYYNYDEDRDEYTNGKKMREAIGEDAKFLFFHVTADIICMNKFADGFLEKGRHNAKIAGAGAGIPLFGTEGRIAYEDEFYGRGVMAIALIGDDLDVKIEAISGLVRISKDYTATKTDDKNIYELDNIPAAKVYNDTLGFLDEENYKDKCLAFPLVTKRGNVEVSRAPVGITDDGGIMFAADVKEGEKYCICYVDNRLHNENLREVLNKINYFQPNAILVYSCISRKGLIKTDVGLVTLLFESIADTSGYFTHGEMIGDGDMINHNNAITLCISLREGEKDREKKLDYVIGIENKKENDMEGFHIRALLKCIENNLEQ